MDPDPRHPGNGSATLYVYVCIYAVYYVIYMIYSNANMDSCGVETNVARVLTPATIGSAPRCPRSDSDMAFYQCCMQ
jgi:hypothetical protein